VYDGGVGDRDGNELKGLDIAGAGFAFVSWVGL
jgi:hypothetical protein